MPTPVRRVASGPAGSGATGSARGAARPRRRDDVLLALVVLLLVTPVLQPVMAQQASRYALTAALVETGGVVLDDYADNLTVDFAERDGRLLSDKAPGQPVLATPAYALYRLVGGESAVHYRPWGNLGLWWVSLWSAAVPLAAIAVMARRAALRLGATPFAAAAAALALTTSTLLLPFGTVLFSHTLTAALTYGAYQLARTRHDPTRRDPLPGDPLPGDPLPGDPLALLAAGTLAALAVTAEYTVAIAAAVVLAVVVRDHRVRALWFLAGAVLPAAGLAIYHTVAFGGPLTTGYEFGGYADLHAVGLLGVTPPRLRMLLQVLVGDRGLLLLTPVVLAAILGAAMLVRERRHTTDAAVGLVLVAAYALLMAGWSSATAGASPGPRYAVVALPFLLPGLAEALRRWTLPTALATIVGWTTMGLAAYTLPLAPRAEPWALGWWLDRVRAGEWADTLAARYLAPELRFAPMLLAAALAGWLLVRAAADSPRPVRLPPRPRAG